MTAKIYYIKQNQSYHKTIDFLNQNNIQYTTQYIQVDPLNWEQLLEILMYTENGVEDIISTKSKPYTVLRENKVDIDELSLTQLHQVINEHPSIIKMPIMIAKNTMFVGYNEEEIRTLKNRKTRKSEYNQVLSTLQMNDVNIPDNELYAY